MLRYKLSFAKSVAIPASGSAQWATFGGGRAGAIPYRLLDISMDGMSHSDTPHQ
jgi:hypothetical protein